MGKGYQRLYLRAPFREEVLISDGEFTGIASGVNISEGGMLVGHNPFYPRIPDAIYLTLKLQFYPHFKNLSLERLKFLELELHPQRVLHFKAKVVREIKGESLGIANGMGVEFQLKREHSTLLLKEYVQSFSTNLIYLQFLFDNLSSDSTIKQKVNKILLILNYPTELGLSMMNKMVRQDYQNLKWL